MEGDSGHEARQETALRPAGPGHGAGAVALHGLCREGEKHITILGTSDIGNIWGFSYEDSKETDNNGMPACHTISNRCALRNLNTHPHRRRG